MSSKVTRFTELISNNSGNLLYNWIIKLKIYNGNWSKFRVRIICILSDNLHQILTISTFNQGKRCFPTVQLMETIPQAILLYNLILYPCLFSITLTNSESIIGIKGIVSNHAVPIHDSTSLIFPAFKYV